MTKTTWLFIGRLNPPHIWHIWIIEKALRENDEVLILLWDNWNIDISNPLDFFQRKQLLKSYFWEKENLNIKIIKDVISDKKWVKNIFTKINSFSEYKKLNFYYWDFENDSAFNVIKEYKNIFLDYNINYILVDRGLSEILYKWEKKLITSTSLRNALMNKEYNLASKFCSKEIFNKIKEHF